MINGQTPRWMQFLERKIGFIGLPNLALYLIVLQIFGFLTTTLSPRSIERIILDPQMVWAGEIWRLFTFIGVPMATSFWMIIFLWFLYFIVDSLEKEWGEFKTTFYLLVSVLLTIAYSFVFNVTITSFAEIETSLFLAAAMLFPNVEILLFFIIPVKLKYLGYFSMALVVYQFVAAETLGRLYLLVAYSNFLVFFGPYLFGEIRLALRRWQNNRRR